MDLEIKGETVLVTGAASGIGKAIAQQFAEEHANVVLIDLNPDVESVADEIKRNRDVETLAHVADITNFTTMQEVVRRSLDVLNSCDHLVCAAGIGSGKYGFPFWKLDPSDWRNVLDVNLMGAVNAVHACVPVMIEAQRGTLLFLSSVAGQIGSQTDPPYSAAKAALINFAQCAAKDLASFNVRVNTICPGMVRTPLNRSVWKAWENRQSSEDRKPYEEWAADKLRRVTPLQRWQEPGDIANLAVFLASSRARNITGQTLNVDGGQVMR